MEKTADLETKPTVVLVHGAFVDGSSWTNVIRILQQDGYPVTAVQLANYSLADDISTTQRVIDAQNGPVILVGHSYGGEVITGAATGKSNVKALVYVSAFALDKGETLDGLGGRFAPPLLATSVIADAGGFIYVNPELFHEVIASDLDPTTTKVLAKTQRPFNSIISATSAPEPAWKTIPSWFLVTARDNALNPDLQRFEAQRIHATTVEYPGSHATIVAHPEAVTNLIEQATQYVSRSAKGEVMASATA